MAMRIDLPPGNSAKDPIYLCSPESVPVVYREGNLVIAEKDPKTNMFSVPMIPANVETLQGIERGLRKLQQMNLKNEAILCIFDGCIGLCCADIQETDKPVKQEMF
jgi:hypothetical protein